MFDAAEEVLKKHDIDPKHMFMQFAVYRNYNSGPEKILQSSPWENKAEGLRAFMDIIEPEGGQGNEAIEIGL